MVDTSRRTPSWPSRKADGKELAHSRFPAVENRLTLTVSRTLGSCGIRREADTRSCRHSWVSRTGLLEGQLLRDGGEQLADIGGGLRRRLEEQKSRLFCVSLRIRCLNGPFVWVLFHHVDFVSCQGDDDVLIGLPLQFLDP